MHTSHSPHRTSDTKDGEKVNEFRERNHSRGSDRRMHREHGDMDNENERMDRRTVKDTTSSRSRHGASTSPLNGHRKNRHTNHSPQQAGETRARNEVPESREAEDGIDESDSVAVMKDTEEALEAQKKQKPSFELSGNGGNGDGSGDCLQRLES